MKNFRQIGATLFLMFTCFLGYSQSESNFIKDWNQLPEDSQRHTEVAYAVVECDGSSFILLNVFNEIGDKKSISFDLTVVQGDREELIQFAPRSFEGGEMLIGDCALASVARIPLPQGMDGSGIEVSINYN